MNAAAINSAAASELTVRTDSRRVEVVSGGQVWAVNPNFGTWLPNSVHKEHLQYRSATDLRPSPRRARWRKEAPMTRVLRQMGSGVRSAGIDDPRAPVWRFAARAGLEGR